jgi:hypothetical protein
MEWLHLMRKMVTCLYPDPKLFSPPTLSSP